MLKPKEFMTQVQDAFDRTRQTVHGVSASPIPHAEELCSQLAARGLVIVEVPPGISHNYTGIPRSVLE